MTRIDKHYCTYSFITVIIYSVIVGNLWFVSSTKKSKHTFFYAGVQSGASSYLTAIYAVYSRDMSAFQS